MRERGERWEEGKGSSLCQIMYPRWRRISEGDWCRVAFLVNIYQMAEHAVGQEAKRNCSLFPCDGFDRRKKRVKLYVLNALKKTVL